MGRLNEKPGEWTGAEGPPLADDLNLLNQGTRQVVAGKGVNVSQFGDRIQIESPDPGPRPADIGRYVGRFVVLQELDDLLYCAPYRQPNDGYQWVPPQYEPARGLDDSIKFFVAKPLSIQKSYWAGRTIAGITYATSSTPSKRLAGVIPEFVRPGYAAGSIITAHYGTTGHIGPDGRVVGWMEFEGRIWDDSITSPDGTVHPPGTVINNYGDVNYFAGSRINVLGNVNLNIADGFTLIIDGPGGVSTCAPLEVCGKLAMCREYIQVVGDIGALAPPISPEGCVPPVIIAYDASGDFAIKGIQLPDKGSAWIVNANDFKMTLRYRNVDVTDIQQFRLPNVRDMVIQPYGAVQVYRGKISPFGNPGVFVLTEIGSPLTAKGDIWVYDGTSDARHPASTDGYFLTCKSSEATGLKYVENPDTSRQGFAQTAHGFTVGQAIYWDGSLWALAVSSAQATIGVGIVCEVINADAFVVQYSGKIFNMPTLTPGDYYYVDSITPGLLVSAEPDTPDWSNPLYLAITATSGVVLPWRPIQDCCGTSVTVEYPSLGSYTVPAGVRTVLVELIGGGGNGSADGGGWGAGYFQQLLTVKLGDTLAWVIGTRGIAAGDGGGTTTLTYVYDPGGAHEATYTLTGQPGVSVGATPTVGGTTDYPAAFVEYNGGIGGTLGMGTSVGGGGASANVSGVGEDGAVDGSGGHGFAGGGSGGDTGNPGVSPGGGGGAGTSDPAFVGADGIVRLTPNPHPSSGLIGDVATARYGIYDVATIQPSAVDTGKLANGAVTQSKLAPALMGYLLSRNLMDY